MHSQKSHIANFVIASTSLHRSISCHPSDRQLREHSIDETRNVKGTNHVPGIHTPLEGLDLGKIPCVFGLEVCILVRGFTFCVFSMKMLCQSKRVRYILGSSLLMMSIVSQAMGSLSMIGANDPTGIYLNCLALLSPNKVSAYGNHRGGCC
jgi:hypothetical protein